MSFLYTPYFGRFRGFDHQPRRGVNDEFNRLAKAQKWSNEETARQRAVCFNEDHEDHFADSGITTKLKRLQDLCVELDVEPKSTITQCKKVLKNTHVNLVDLMIARRTGKQVKKFKSYYQLKAYTKATPKFFSKKLAKDDVLKVLLKPIV